jgi:hypothetical protein
LAEGCAFVLAVDQVLVEALHEGGREDVVGRPEAGEDRFGSGKEESTLKTGDTFLAEESPGPGVAGRQRDQALVLRVATTDGSDFEDDKGRIGVGFVEEEYVGLAPCSQTSQYYSETTFRESSMGGIELDGEGNAVPFVYFHIPNPVPEEVFWAEYYYDEDSFSVDGVSKLSIQIYYGAQSMYLYVSNSVTGEELYSRQGISYPTPRMAG